MAVKSLIAADEIFNKALQVLNAHQVPADDVPLVMAHVSHRMEAFAIGELARNVHAAQSRIAELEQVDEQPEEEGTE